MKTLKQVESYARKVIPKLNLSHWDISFFEADSEGEVMGTCHRDHAYKRANIMIDVGIYSETLRDQKITVIHELLHCHSAFWESDVNELKSDPSISLSFQGRLFNSVMIAEEECVELLARAFYKLIEGGN